MAEQWADYVITAVRFNAAGTHISEVRTYEHTGSELNNQAIKTRATVVNGIEAGYSYCTALKNADGTYRYGAPVKVVTIEGTKFIKTKSDSSKEDNLDNLPSF